MTTQVAWEGQNGGGGKTGLEVITISPYGGPTKVARAELDGAPVLCPLLSASPVLHGNKQKIGFLL